MIQSGVWRGILLALTMLLSACASHTVRTTETTAVMQADPATPEEQLLDVGVRLFDPGAEKIKEDEIFTAPEIRKAEARFMPGLLVDTLQKSGHWGAVRIMPEGTGVTDLMVNGRIIESTGERLELEISVADASGKHWYTKSYEGLASKYSYSGTRAPEPFQDVYNRIANDLALARAKLPATEAARLRSIAELLFAESFSPQAFGGYLAKDNKGIVRLRRLPAEDDPMLVRVRSIRERDQLFIDTLQDYYAGFSRQMATSYQDWRKESYTESVAYKELQRQALVRKAMGVAAVLGGIAMQTGDSQATRTAGVVGIVGGASMVKSGFDRSAEAKMHAETLREIGGSLGAEIDPQVLELEDRTVTLKGTVQDQYGQWREILHGIYASETGSI